MRNEEACDEGVMLICESFYVTPQSQLVFIGWVLFTPRTQTQSFRSPASSCFTNSFFLWQLTSNFGIPWRLWVDLYQCITYAILENHNFITQIKKISSTYAILENCNFILICEWIPLYSYLTFRWKRCKINLKFHNWICF